MVTQAMEKEAQVKVKKTTMTEVQVKTESWGWVRLLMEEETGRVVIVSDYGEWSYCWWSIGDDTLATFLAKLNSQYMGEKLLGLGLRVHSDTKSIQAIRESILSARKDGSLGKKEAAEEWDLVKQFEDGWCDFRGWCEQTKWFADCPWEQAREEVVGYWETFWDKIWVPHVVPALKELAA